MAENIEVAIENIPIHIMGKEYLVPAGLTIMEAIEYAGYKFIRGAGCRAGFCGACGTIYRKDGDYRIYAALACQTSVEEGMYLTQIPFTPTIRFDYELEETNASDTTLLAMYPEIARCVSCNTCTKICPQELDVMDYIQSALRGDITETAKLSFDCVQCGLCSMRCPAEIPHYHVAQLARRLYGMYLDINDPFLPLRVDEIEKGLYNEEYKRLQSLTIDELKKEYVAQMKK
jgi:succinate dehydrogenase/fumarate reductase-like Fe-S protein